MSGYIGTQPVPQATQTRDSFTATSGQTSFATGGYTPNFLDVYLNGVKLAAADYTASNGSDVVLASGAATGDILEVVAFNTFTPANIPSGTPSIDDNGNATLITIDASDRVLIDTTNISATAQSGNSMTYDNGRLEVQKYRSPALRVGNYTDAFGTYSGNLVEFYSGGATVGSIGTNGGNPYFAQASKGIGLSSARMYPVTNTGAVSDNTIDIGNSNARFKDAYLSGGIYLGGAGASNKLDDFEEGLYTVSVATGSGSISLNSTNNKFSYVKVGKLVTVTGRIDVSSVSSPTGPLYLNLPFAASTGVKYESAISVFIWNATSSAPETGLWIGWVTNGASHLHLRYGNSNTPSANVANYIHANTEFRIGVSYQTDS